MILDTSIHHVNGRREKEIEKNVTNQNLTIRIRGVATGGYMDIYIPSQKISPSKLFMG